MVKKYKMHPYDFQVYSGQSPLNTSANTFSAATVTTAKVQKQPESIDRWKMEKKCELLFTSKKKTQSSHVLENEGDWE